MEGSSPFLASPNKGNLAKALLWSDLEVGNGQPDDQEEGTASVKSYRIGKSQSGDQEEEIAPIKS